MELARDSLMPRSTVHWIKWPKIPQTKIGKAGERNAERKPPRKDDTPEEQPTRIPKGCDVIKSGVEIRNLETAVHEVTPSSPAISHPDIGIAEGTLSPESQKSQTGVEVEEHNKNSENINSSTTESPLPQAELKIAEQSTTPQSSRFMDRKQLIARLKLKAPTWPNPELSLGTKCNSLGGNECWVAVGPAQELFTQVANKIAELLDNRVDELEEGESVAGNVLTFGMYMMGSRPNNARPTLIFTCQSVNPRKRAIKYVKQSGILKGHPKILLAQSSMCPLAAGRGYLRLLSTSSRRTDSDESGLLISLSFKRELHVEQSPDPVPASGGTGGGLSLGENIAIGISTPVGVFLIIGVLVFFFRRRRQKFATVNRDPISEAPQVSMIVQSTSMGHPQIPITNVGLSFIPQSASLSQPPSRTQEYVPESDVDIITTFPSIEPVPLKLNHTSTSHHQMRDPEKEWTLNLRDKNRSVMPAPPGHYYRGIPIHFERHRRATIGGFIQSRGHYFGLTVGHVLEPSFYTSSNPQNPIYEDFAFDHDDEDGNEAEETDVNVTSEGNSLQIRTVFFCFCLETEANYV